MLTLLVYGLLAVAVIAGLFVLAVVVLPKGAQISPPTPDTRPWESLPQRTLRPEDIIAARLPVAIRGYRFAETDLLLDRLTEELRERDEEISRLRGSRAVSPGEHPFGTSAEDGFGSPGHDDFGSSGDDDFGSQGEHPFGTPAEDGFGSPAAEDGFGSPGDDEFGTLGDDEFGPPGER